jgi:hypothetical protein
VASNRDKPWDRVQRASLLVGVAALAACAVGAFFLPSLFLRSYLVAYVYWLGIATGCLAILMVYHLTGGGWGLVTRRILEPAAGTLPLLAALFLPIALGLPQLYLWAQPEAAEDPILAHKQPYLNATGFVVRAAVYFAVWIALALLLNYWSREQDDTTAPGPTLRMRVLSGPGLVLYWLAMTFASIDWVMSLQPDWHSTIFPVVFILGQALSALAFVIAVLQALAARPPLSEIVAIRHFRDLGNLQLALVMFWAYVAFSQFLLVWIANLPDETVWYIVRFYGGWKWVAAGVMLFQFGLAFLLLLSNRVKKTPARLTGVAGLLLATSFVNYFWQIIPAFQFRESGGGAGLLPHLADLIVALLALAGVGGIWLAAFLGRLDEARLVPRHDPNLKEAPSHG